MLEGCLSLIFQLLHISFSLSALLILANDLQGSIVVDPNTGTVMNYQDMGGGISALFTVLVITGIVWAVIRMAWAKNREKALLAHFTIVFVVKAALIYSIYFSGRIDSRILQRFALHPKLFAADAVAIIIAAVILLINAEQEDKKVPSDTYTD